jgi:hypothetical protein
VLTHEGALAVGLVVPPVYRQQGGDVVLVCAGEDSRAQQRTQRLGPMRTSRCRGAAACPDCQPGQMCRFDSWQAMHSMRAASATSGAPLSPG